MARTRRLAFLLAALALCAWSEAVLAACRLGGNASADFGSVSSFDIALAAKTTSALSAGLACDAPTILGLLGDDLAGATVQSQNGGKLKNAGGDLIPFQIFADGAFSNQIVPGQQYDYYNAYILGLLGILGGSGARDFPMYFRTQPAGLNVGAGTYTDKLTIRWDWSVCSIVVLGACVGKNTGNGTVTLDLKLKITEDCTITAPDLNFGSAPLVRGFAPVTQTIKVRCTKSAQFSVGLGDGANANGSQRRMRSGGNYLLYDIYKGTSGSERWGRTGTARRGSSSADVNPGSYDGLVGQSFHYRAEVLQNQATPGAGTYADTIIVDIEF